MCLLLIYDYTLHHLSLIIFHCTCVELHVIEDVWMLVNHIGGGGGSKYASFFNALLRWYSQFLKATHPELRYVIGREGHLDQSDCSDLGLPLLKN